MLSSWIATAVLVMVVTNAVALAGLRLVHAHFHVESRQYDRDILGHAAGITGVINAVLFAFIVFVAWTYYDRARDTVDQETSVVWQIWHDVEAMEPNEAGDPHAPKEGRPLAGVLSAKDHARVARELKLYARDVAGGEWEVMGDWTRHREVNAYRDQFEKADDLLRDAYYTVLKADIGSRSGISAKRAGLSVPRLPRDPAMAAAGTQRVVIAELVRRFNDLFELRRRRIAMSSEGAIPAIVWATLLVGGALCIACCWLIGFKNTTVHAVVMSLIGSSLSLIVFLIFSLNTPFGGVAPISNDRYAALADDIDHWEERETRGLEGDPLGMNIAATGEEAARARWTSSRARRDLPQAIVVPRPFLQPIDPALAPSPAAVRAIDWAAQGSRLLQSDPFTAQGQSMPVGIIEGGIRCQSKSHSLSPRRCSAQSRSRRAWSKRRKGDSSSRPTAPRIRRSSRDS